MEAIQMIKERRSVRKYKDTKVDKDIMKEIIEIARWAPSWKNYQIARYTLVENNETINKIATEAVNNFVYNTKTLTRATGVAVLSFVNGKSGKLDTGEYATSKDNTWETFDAGIACQTFCLAAHAKGVGTCIMGIIDDKTISDIVNLPKNETVAALIVYGYPEGEARMTSREEVETIMRYAK